MPRGPDRFDGLDLDGGRVDAQLMDERVDLEGQFFVVGRVRPAAPGGDEGRVTMVVQGTAGKRCATAVRILGAPNRLPCL